METKFTLHADDRIRNRLGGLCNKNEVASAISASHLSTGENYVIVKRFPRRMYLGDPSLPETPKGDQIVAKVICENATARVITVMLRKSQSVSDRYHYNR